MADDESGKKTSDVVRILQLLGYVLCFFVPAVVLALIFPEYALWIILGAMTLLLSVTSFLVGLEWDEPHWTPEVRKLARHVGVVIMLSTLHPLVIRRTWRATLATLCTAAMLACTFYLPFFLGRAVKARRRDREPVHRRYLQS